MRTQDWVILFLAAALGFASIKLSEDYYEALAACRAAAASEHCEAVVQ